MKLRIYMVLTILLVTLISWSSSATTESKALPMSELETFLEAGKKEELPKSFHFQTLKFKTGTPSLVPGASAELEKVASILKKYPTAKIKIEGYADVTAYEPDEKFLAKRRALTVQQQVVDRGVEENRVSHEGHQNKDGENRVQVDFIVTEMK